MSITKLGDDLMKVPKLDASGTNWVVYKDRFLWAVDARGLLDHVDGSRWEPTRPAPVQKKVVDASGKEMIKIGDDDKLLSDWEEKLKTWKQGEAVVKQQIAATIPDSLFMKVQGKGTALEIWKVLMADFQNKSWMVSVDLRCRLQQLQCAEKGDVRAHFSTLRTMREDLAAMGHSPSDDDFYAIVLGSLPPSYDSFISALNATSSVLGAFLSPDDLMQTTTEEYDRRVLAKGGKKEENVAFHAGDNGGKGKRNPHIKCFNCNKKGHKKADCWAEGGGKASQGPKGKAKAKESTSDGKDKDKDKPKAATASSSSETQADAAWMAMSAFPEIDDLFDNSELPDLVQLPESDDDSDDGDLDEQSAAFEDEETDDEDFLSMDSATLATEKEPDLPDEAYTTTYTKAELENSVNIDLYDSGASRHMSGYRHRFTNFVTTDPYPITTADKRTFNAIGKGDMYIYVPNEDGHLKILLRDVLFAPSMGVTLVSISRMTTAGSTAIFSGSSCRLYTSSWKLLGRVDMHQGLYRVFQP